MIQTQTATTLSRVPDVLATVGENASGTTGVSVFRYSGLVVHEPDSYVRLGEGGCYDLSGDELEEAVEE